MTSPRTVERLSIYRRILSRLDEEGSTSVYSHEIAEAARVSPAQVRRDLMSIGYSGVPNRGYDIGELLRSLGEHLDAPEGQNVCLVGAGALGRAVVEYVSRQRPKLHVAAVFDVDPKKVGRKVRGHACYDVSEIPEVVDRERIDLGIVTVPARAAQEVADRLVEAGVTGLLNFAPHRLRVPAHVHVEDMDLIQWLEKVAFFARTRGGEAASNGRASGRRRKR